MAKTLSEKRDAANRELEWAKWHVDMSHETYINAKAKLAKAREVKRALDAQTD